MRFFLRIYIFILLLSVLGTISGCPEAYAGRPTLFDGEDWNAIPNTLTGKANKGSYLRGVYEGAAFMDPDASYNVFYYDIEDRRSLILALDSFYGDYRNVKIPVPYALAIIGRQIRGEEPEDIERHVRQLRREFSE